MLSASTRRQPGTDPLQQVMGPWGAAPWRRGAPPQPMAAGSPSDRRLREGGEGPKPVTCLSGAGQSAGEMRETLGLGRAIGAWLRVRALHVGLCAPARGPARWPRQLRGDRLGAAAALGCAGAAGTAGCGERGREGGRGGGARARASGGVRPGGGAGVPPRERCRRLHPALEGRAELSALPT